MDEARSRRDLGKARQGEGQKGLFVTNEWSHRIANDDENWEMIDWLLQWRVGRIWNLP